MILYNLGEKLNKNHLKLKSYISELYEIHDCDNDFSILTQNNVQLVIFCLNQENNAFYEMCCKACRNLNKKLIVLSDNSKALDYHNDNNIIFQINTSKPNAEILFCETLNKLTKKQKDNKKETHSTNNKQNTLQTGTKIDIYQVVGFIDNNLDKEINERDVAKICHYSAPYFSKLFHQALGIRFRDYVINKRIQKAKSLLTSQPNEKISSIAYQCGYNDLAYFSRIFKKKTGLTPGEYRKL